MHKRQIKTHRVRLTPIFRESRQPGLFLERIRIPGDNKSSGVSLHIQRCAHICNRNISRAVCV